MLFLSFELIERQESEKGRQNETTQKRKQASHGGVTMESRRTKEQKNELSIPDKFSISCVKEDVFNTCHQPPHCLRPRLGREGVDLNRQIRQWRRTERWALPRRTRACGNHEEAAEERPARREDVGCWPEGFPWRPQRLTLEVPGRIEQRVEDYTNCAVGPASRRQMLPAEKKAENLGSSTRPARAAGWRQTAGKVVATAVVGVVVGQERKAAVAY